MSTYEEIKNARTRVNNCVIPSGGGHVRCRHCIEQPKLEVRKDGVGVCVRGCGLTFRLEERVDQETGGIILVPTTTIPKVKTVRYGALNIHAGEA